MVAEIVMFVHRIWPWVVGHPLQVTLIAIIAFVALVRYRLLTDLLDLVIIGVLTVWLWVGLTPIFIALVPFLCLGGFVPLIVSGWIVLLFRRRFGHHLWANVSTPIEDGIGNHFVDPPLDAIQHVIDCVVDGICWLYGQIRDWVLDLHEAICLWLEDRPVPRTLLGLACFAFVAMVMAGFWTAWGNR